MMVDKLQHFDPSDTDASQQLAYKALRLAEYVEHLLDMPNAIQGRDARTELSLRLFSLGKALHLNWHEKSEVLETDPQIIHRILLHRDSQ